MDNPKDSGSGDKEGATGASPPAKLTDDAGAGSSVGAKVSSDNAPEEQEHRNEGSQDGDDAPTGAALASRLTTAEEDDARGDSGHQSEGLHGDNEEPTEAAPISDPVTVGELDTHGDRGPWTGALRDKAGEPTETAPTSESVTTEQGNDEHYDSDDLYVSMDALRRPAPASGPVATERGNEDSHHGEDAPPGPASAPANVAAEHRNEDSHDGDTTTAREALVTGLNAGDDDSVPTETKEGPQTSKLPVEPNPWLANAPAAAGPKTVRDSSPARQEPRKLKPTALVGMKEAIRSYRGGKGRNRLSHRSLSKSHTPSNKAMSTRLSGHRYSTYRRVSIRNSAMAVERESHEVIQNFYATGNEALEAAAEAGCIDDCAYEPVAYYLFDEAKKALKIMSQILVQATGKSMHQRPTKEKIKEMKKEKRKTRYASTPKEEEKEEDEEKGERGEGKAKKNMDFVSLLDQLKDRYDTDSKGGRGKRQTSLSEWSSSSSIAGPKGKAKEAKRSLGPLLRSATLRATTSQLSAVPEQQEDTQQDEQLQEGKQIQQDTQQEKQPQQDQPLPQDDQPQKDKRGKVLGSMFYTGAQKMGPLPGARNEPPVAAPIQTPPRGTRVRTPESPTSRRGTPATRTGSLLAVPGNVMTLEQEVGDVDSEADDGRRPDTAARDSVSMPEAAGESSQQGASPGSVSTPGVTGKSSRQGAPRGSVNTPGVTGESSRQGASRGNMSMPAQEPWNVGGWTVDGARYEQMSGAAGPAGPGARAPTGVAEPSPTDRQRLAVMSMANELAMLQDWAGTPFEERQGMHNTAENVRGTWFDVNDAPDCCYMSIRGIIWQFRHVKNPLGGFSDEELTDAQTGQRGEFLHLRARNMWYKVTREGWCEIQKAPANVRPPRSWQERERGRRGRPAHRDQEEAPLHWLFRLLLMPLVPIFAPFRQLYELYLRADKTAQFQSMMHALQLFMFLFNMLTVYANKRERNAWLEANGLTRLNMLNFLTRQPSRLMPAVDFSYVDYTYPMQIVFFFAHTFLGVMRVRLPETKRWAESLLETFCRTGAGDVICASTLVLLRFLWLRVFDTLTMPLQIFRWISAEDEALARNVFELVLNCGGIFLAYRLFLQQHGWLLGHRPFDARMLQNFLGWAANVWWLLIGEPDV